ncbi:MAG: sialic acid TRAP transporter substrate-binding protein SiaP [Bacillota bacterium]
MKTRLMAILMTIMLIVSLAVVYAAPKTFNLKFTTVSVPGDAHTRAIYVFKDEIEKLSKGQVKVEVFHSGQLVTQEGTLPAIMRGTVEMGYLGAGWLSDAVPYLSMFMSGYFFKDYNHMTTVLNGKIGREIFEDVAKKTGVRVLGAYYLCARHLNLRDIGREVRTPADLKGIKLRMPNTPTYINLGKALGANPTPLSFTEVYMALKTGTIDGQDNPLPTDKNAKFYEVTKYIILTGHLLDSVWPAINEKIWQEMGPSLQKKMYAAIEKGREFCDKTNLLAEMELVDFFKQQGLIIIQPDINVWAEHVRKYYLENKELSANWDMKLYERVMAAAK